MVSFGNASGPVTGVDLGILNKKGSLFVTRPSLFGYITNREELDRASGELFRSSPAALFSLTCRSSRNLP